MKFVFTWNLILFLFWLRSLSLAIFSEFSYIKCARRARTRHSAASCVINAKSPALSLESSWDEIEQSFFVSDGASQWWKIIIHIYVYGPASVTVSVVHMISKSHTTTQKIKKKNYVNVMTNSDFY